MTTARERTNIVKRILGNAGYIVGVTSTPTSHRAQLTTVTDPYRRDEAVASLLTAHLSDQATVSLCEGFVSVSWAE